MFAFLLQELDLLQYNFTYIMIHVLAMHFQATTFSECTYELALAIVCYKSCVPEHKSQGCRELES